jgi:hypothetical protein
MKNILSSRGIETETIVRDRQGRRFFEIRDPAGNAIGIVVKDRLCSPLHPETKPSKLDI